MRSRCSDCRIFRLIAGAERYTRNHFQTISPLGVPYSSGVRRILAHGESNMKDNGYNPATDKTVLKLGGEYYTIIREKAFAFYLYSTLEGYQDEMIRYRTKNQAIKRARSLNRTITTAKRQAEIDALTADLQAILDHFATA
jgi:hypothetical protein